MGPRLCAARADRRRGANPGLRIFSPEFPADLNALIAAKTMKGINDFEVDAIPHAELQQVLRKYNRLVQTGK